MKFYKNFLDLARFFVAFIPTAKAGGFSPLFGKFYFFANLSKNFRRDIITPATVPFVFSVLELRKEVKKMLTSVVAFGVSVIASIVGNFIYDKFFKQ